MLGTCTTRYYHVHDPMPGTCTTRYYNEFIEVINECGKYNNNI